jgi:hypothetical protein
VLKRLVFSPPERERLTERVRSRSTRAEEVQRGKVIVFEPGTNNLPYIEKNSLSLKNLQLIKSAVGNYSEKRLFEQL